jgi:hypothetical protein
MNNVIHQSKKTQMIFHNLILCQNFEQSGWNHQFYTSAFLCPIVPPILKKRLNRQEKGIN